MIEQQIKQYLKDNKIKFEEFEHDSAFTCKEQAKALGVEEKEIAKSLLFKVDGSYFIQVIAPGNKSVNAKMLKETLKAEKFELASPEEVLEISGCQPGCVSPFVDAMPRKEKVRKTYMDMQLTRQKEVFISLGKHTKTFKISKADLLKLTKAEVIELDPNKLKKEAKTKQANGDAKDIGITVKKEQDISEWYTQAIQKAELIEYTKVSGCIVFRPRSYAIWEKIQKFFDDKIKKSGVKNAYFPLFIPESLLCKEQEHVEGFTPEVAWVTHAGESKLAERLAIRPTSETIMYDSYSKWIRSYKDLPLRINQWCNIVRWEFKNPIPFLRNREFLWQEGHSCFATEQEADKEVREILDYYDDIYKDLLAIATLKGRKSEKEKFAGANYTTSLEIFLPNGKAIQGCTSHALGQNFSKAFDIGYLNEKGEKQLVWQNSWGFTTRSIGILVMMHGDNQGLIIPPYAAPLQIVIVPIFKDEHKDKILDECKKLKEKLSEDFSVEIDARDDYTPGWKFNDHEMKGVPLRIEVGPKDIEKKQCVIVTRHDRKKEFVPVSEAKEHVEKAMKRMHNELYERSKKLLDESIMEAGNWEEFMKAINSKMIAFAPWCGSEECEDWLKDKSGGAKSLNIPFDEAQPKLKKGTKCVQCEEEANFWAYFAKSY